MIIAELTGGLGNQLFQYAAGRNLAEMRGTKFRISTLNYQRYKLHAFSLNHFCIEAEEATQKEVNQFTQPITRLTDLLKPIHKRSVFRERQFHFDSSFCSIGDNTLLRGYFQSEKYFSPVSGILRQEFSVKSPLSGKTKEVESRISNTSSVSVHVRRGDYINDSKINRVHGVCDISYYNNSVKMISDVVENPFFFIFSDDPEWVKENIRLSFPSEFVNHNDSSNNFQDLYLMSRCKHNIIANSSFSWWGAWLNSHPDKIVIAPSKWFNDSKRNSKDIVPESWVRI